MKIDSKKIFHSKCPSCKEYGLPAWRPGSNGQGKLLVCEHCGKHFRTSWGVNFIATVAILCIHGGFFRFVILDTWLPDCPSWLEGLIIGICYVTGITAYILYQRIAPLYEVDDETE